MFRCLNLLLLQLFCLVCFSDVSVQRSFDLFRVRMGEVIELNCRMRNRYEVAWYHLRSEELVLLISAEKDETETELLINYNLNSTHLKIRADSWITTVSLFIYGVTESDLGLYFCGTTSDTPEMHFNRTIRLSQNDDPDGADWNLSNKLLILLTALFSCLLHHLLLEGPR